MKIEIDAEIPEGYEATGEYRRVREGDYILYNGAVVYVTNPACTAREIILRPIKPHVQQALDAFNTSNYHDGWELVSTNEDEFFRHPKAEEWFFALGGDLPCKATAENIWVFINETEADHWHGKRLIIRRKQKKAEDLTGAELIGLLCSVYDSSHSESKGAITIITEYTEDCGYTAINRCQWKTAKAITEEQFREYLDNLKAALAKANNG